MSRASRTCPECGYPFAGNGFDGIDAHWRSEHESIMPYSEAWPLIRSGRYEPFTIKAPQVKWTKAQLEEHNRLVAEIAAKSRKKWDYNSATWVGGKGPFY